MQRSLTVLSLCLTALAPGQHGRAPDGREGFGVEFDQADARRLFLSRDDEHEAFLERLHSLESEIRILMLRFETSYGKRGYLDLLERGTPESIGELHAAWFAIDDPIAALAAGGKRARALAQAAADVRFRLRAEVLHEIDLEFADLTGALGLMQASFDGFADLNQTELDHLARRADIAASMLRAARLDLEALREDDTLDGAQASKDLLALASGKKQSSDTARAALEGLERRQRKMQEALFTTRLRERLRAELDWRAQQREAGERIVLDVRTLMPDTPEGQDAPPEIARLSKSKRYEFAARAAVQGLSYDPLSSELNWFAGEALDLPWGPLESRRYFDRFLALRGIRAHDARSYRYSDLAERERRALERVQTPIDPPR